MGCVHELFADRDVKPGPVPADILAYWRSKKFKVGFDYRDVWNEEHDWAFTAAKIMRTDVLAVVRGELDRAIRDGVPFDAFKRDIEPKLVSLGWWDKQEVEDPKTGKVVTVNPPSRLRTIFETNMRTARAVGQYDRIRRNRRARPYLLYQVGPSIKHRELHLSWHGLLLPVDDPFWGYAYPPNGYGCKCWVRAVSPREADRLEAEGIPAPNPEPERDDEGNPTGHVVDQRVAVRREAPELRLLPYLNKRTGVTDFVPEGIDPGFHHTPGEGRARALKAAE